jgi:HEAT repeat protein
MRPYLAALVLLVSTLTGAAQQLSFEEAVARLKLPDPSARLQALGLLAESGYAEAGPAIAALLHDPDERVQRAALYAELAVFLSTRLELRRKVGLIVEVRDERPAARLFEDPWAWLPVSPVPDEVVTALAGAITHRDPALRLEAIYTMGLLAQIDGRRPTAAHKEVAEALADRLGDPTPQARAAAARAAGRIFRRCPAPCEAPGLSRLGDALVHTLNDPDRLVRLAALSGLGDMRWERSVQSLTAGFEYYGGKGDGLPYLATLARVAHPSSVPTLKGALLHREPAFRLVAGEGLARVGGPEAVAASAALDGDRSAAVRVAAAFALASSGQAAGIDRLVQAVDAAETRPQARDYLIELGSPVASFVAAALASGPAEKRVALIQVLGVVGGPAELAALESQRSAGAAVAEAERAALRLRARTP